MEKGDVNPLSIAGGLDYGVLSRCGIPQPNFLEAMVESIVRVYIKVLNISSLQSQTVELNLVRIV